MQQMVLAATYYTLNLTWPQLTVSIMAAALLVAYATRSRSKP